MSEEEVKRIVDQRIMEVLGDFSEVPIEVKRSFETLLSGISLSASTKTVASETQAVNEGGASSYNVPKLIDGFVETRGPSGVTIYIPYYT